MLMKADDVQATGSGVPGTLLSALDRCVTHSALGTAPAGRYHELHWFTKKQWV